MKKIISYFAAGCVAAIIGMYFSDLCGDFFNGMDYGSACVLGMGMYLCIVVITCTGIIVSKPRTRPEDRSPDQEQNKYE